MLRRVAAQVAAAMPSAQHPALHNSPASHVAVGMSVRMSAPGLFMRKLPLGRAQVTVTRHPRLTSALLSFCPYCSCPQVVGVKSQWRGAGWVVCPQPPPPKAQGPVTAGAALHLALLKHHLLVSHSFRLAQKG